MRDVNFGCSLQYDEGKDSSVALNNQGRVVEIHTSQSHDKLYYWTGRLHDMDVTWSSSHEHDDGITPSIALNDAGIVVEVHYGGDNNLWCNVGMLEGDDINWGKHAQQYDTGTASSIAIDNDGWCVEVHQGKDNDLWFQLGKVKTDTMTIDWNQGYKERYDGGRQPQIAMNNHGVIVEVHKLGSRDRLFARVGKLDKTAKTIQWGSLSPEEGFANGVQPSIAIADNGVVIEVHKNECLDTLWRGGGKIDEVRLQIFWMDGGFEFDTGEPPSVACSATMAVQTHKSEEADTLWFSTSLITDRACWMQDNLEFLQNKSLKQVVLPASHDSCMYKESDDLHNARAQDFTVYQQLAYGIRYFDFRPTWNSRDNTFYIHHGPTIGRKLSDVLYDVQRFMNEGYRELVIVKFSHYDSFDDTIYQKMVSQIKEQIGSWLYTAPLVGRRLADIKMSEFLKEHDVVLVVCDGDFQVGKPCDGIWVYRDGWPKDGDSKPTINDLRVFDWYANNPSYNEMSLDQVQKFNNYKGICKGHPEAPCDMFLLSWILTVHGSVHEPSKVPNSNLGKVMTELTIPNGDDCIVNLLYTDYVESGRVTDIAIIQNKKLQTT